MSTHLGAFSDPKPVRSYANDNRALAAKFSQWLEVQNYALNTRRTYTP